MVGLIVEIDLFRAHAIAGRFINFVVSIERVIKIIFIFVITLYKIYSFGTDGCCT